MRGPGAANVEPAATRGLEMGCHPRYLSWMLQTIETLPESATVEDAIERLVVLYKVERGIAEADAGKTTSHHEARERMAKWLK